VTPCALAAADSMEVEGLAPLSMSSVVNREKVEQGQGQGQGQGQTQREGRRGRGNMTCWLVGASLNAEVQSLHCGDNLGE